MQTNRYVTHYEILGVPPASTQEELHVAYKKLALQYHPDKGGDTDKFAGITAAYTVLKDPKRRKQYDAQLRLLGKPCPACDGRGVRYVFRSMSPVKTVTCAVCKGTGQAK